MTGAPHPNDLLARGDLAASRGRHDEAIASYLEALARVPGHPLVLARIATSWFDLGDVDRAADYFAQAAHAAPGEARHWHNLGAAHQRGGRPDAAEAAWRQATRADPRYWRSWLELARREEATARVWAAAASYRQALAGSPGNADCLLGLSRVTLNQGHAREALRWAGRALRGDAADRPARYSHYLVTAHHCPGLGARALARLARGAARFHRDPPAGSVPRVRRPGPLRLGFLSPRLGDSPTGHMLLALLPHLDRTRLEVYCYATVAIADAVNRRLREHAHWRDVATSGEDALVQAIRDDAIDVLVDLAGHCPGGSVGAMCRRAAPVQWSWLDYFDSMGLAAYDGIVSDAVSTPPELAPGFTETLVTLPACRFLFAPPLGRPDPGPLPALRAGHLAFGCFNRLSKVNDAVARAWARVLAAVPGSTLTLKNASLDAAGEHARHRERLAALGIDPARVRLLPYTDEEALWRDYRDVDIALDPFPFNGGISTFDALSMGVPVVALAGDGMVSRQSASLLAAAGMDGWVARTVDGYVDLAARMAADLPALAALRAGMRGALARSPLCDGPAFARAFERHCLAAHAAATGTP